MTVLQKIYGNTTNNYYGSRNFTNISQLIHLSTYISFENRQCTQNDSYYFNMTKQIISMNNNMLSKGIGRNFASVPRLCSIQFKTNIDLVSRTFDANSISKRRINRVLLHLFVPCLDASKITMIIIPCSIKFYLLTQVSRLYLCGQADTTEHHLLRSLHTSFPSHIWCICGSEYKHVTFLKKNTSI